jgi:hypothetical protein
MEALRLLCLAALLSACGQFVQSEPGMNDVQLTAQPTPRTAGDSISLVLANRSSGTVGYNLCTSSLQRRSGDGWHPVPEDRVCTLELRMLPPGEQARFGLALPSQLEAGDYRYATRVENIDTGEAGEALTEPFRIPG